MHVYGMLVFVHMRMWLESSKNKSSHGQLVVDRGEQTIRNK
jgi:hypothetical protein